MKKRLFLFAIPLLLVAIYAIGPMPKTPEYATNWPQISENPEEYVTKTEARTDIKKGNAAEIIWFNDSTKQKTDYVLLYIHGYTASKVEGQPVYQDFAARYGCNVFAARLAAQGIDTAEPMLSYTADRMWHSAKEALAVAEKLGKKVIIMSTSTGGTLALKLAATFPEKVAALINLSPNIRPKPWNAALLNKPWGKQIAGFVLGSEYRILEKRDTIYEKFWYDKYRIESLVQMQELVESSMTPETFAAVTCPVLNIFYFKNEQNQDEVVKTDKIIWMHNLLGTQKEKKRLVTVENAGTHVIGCGIYSKSVSEVEAAIFSFTQEVLLLKPRLIAN